MRLCLTSRRPRSDRGRSRRRGPAYPNRTAFEELRCGKQLVLVPGRRISLNSWCPGRGRAWQPVGSGWHLPRVEVRAVAEPPEGDDARLPFRDRREAGRVLAGALAGIQRRTSSSSALPRGGVPVAYEVAEAPGGSAGRVPGAQLGVPGREEVAMGAIASGGVRVLNRISSASSGFPADIGSRRGARGGVGAEAA